MTIDFKNISHRLAASETMQKVLTVVVNVCRFLLALTFVFSGYVKAIDPTGTKYKIEDYLAAVGLGGILPDYVTIAMAYCWRDWNSPLAYSCCWPSDAARYQSSCSSSWQ